MHSPAFARQYPSSTFGWPRQPYNTAPAHASHTTPCEHNDDTVNGLPCLCMKRALTSRQRGPRVTSHTMAPMSIQYTSRTKDSDQQDMQGRAWTTSMYKRRAHLQGATETTATRKLSLLHLARSHCLARSVGLGRGARGAVTSHVGTWHRACHRCAPKRTSRSPGELRHRGGIRRCLSD